MDDNQALTSHLYALTPTLVADTVAYMQEDAILMMRYSSSIHEMAEQAVVSFRDVLLGAVQFGAPQLVDSEIKWLQGLLEARQVDALNLQRFLTLHRRRLSENLPPNLAAPVLAMLDRLMAKLDIDEIKENGHAS